MPFTLLTELRLSPAREIDGLEVGRMPQTEISKAVRIMADLKTGTLTELAITVGANCRWGSHPAVTVRFGRPLRLGARSSLDALVRESEACVADLSGLLPRALTGARRGG